MKINVKAKPRVREDKVEKIDEQNFVVSVTEPPVQGRANIAILKLLGKVQYSDLLITTNA